MRKYGKIIFGGVVIVILAFVAIFAPYIAPYGYWQQDLMNNLQEPSLNHFFGTDNFGRDIFSRVIFGTRVSLISAVASAGIASAVGLSLGTIAGYLGGWIDRITQTAIDICWSIPTILWAVFLVTIAQPGLGTTILAISLVYWAQYARIIRGEALRTREEGFVEAAEALGASRPRIMLYHLLPNVISPVIVMVSITAGYAILLEAMLGFLGFGVQPPRPSWGIVLSEGRNFLTQAPWIAVFPGIVISLAVLAFNFLGDGLRDHLDPHMKGTW